MNKRKTHIKIFAVVLLTLGALVMVIPFVWCLSTSIQGSGKAYEIPPKLFQPPYQFGNYVKVWMEANLFQYSLNSIFVTVLCIIGSTIADAIVGYGLAKYDFKASNVVFILSLSTMFVPGNILAIPQYVMWQKLNLLDTYIPIIAPKFFGDAMGIFLMRQCFKSISNQLYEAAVIDGCHPVKIFSRIYLPLVKPMLATLVIRMFISEWNDIFGPLIYITTKSKYTLTIGLLYLRGEYLQNLELLMAASVITMLPIIVVYLFSQKYFVQGMVSSGIKG